MYCRWWRGRILWRFIVVSAWFCLVIGLLSTVRTSRRSGSRSGPGWGQGYQIGEEHRDAAGQDVGLGCAEGADFGRDSVGHVFLNCVINYIYSNQNQTIIKCTAKTAEDGASTIRREVCGSVCGLLVSSTLRSADWDWLLLLPNCTLRNCQLAKLFFGLAVGVKVLPWLFRPPKRGIWRDSLAV